jgi:hypothetical protein
VSLGREVNGSSGGGTLSEADGISPAWKGGNHGGQLLQVKALSISELMGSSSGGRGVRLAEFLRVALLCFSKSLVLLWVLPLWIWYQSSSPSKEESMCQHLVEAPEDEDCASHPPGGQRRCRKLWISLLLCSYTLSSYDLRAMSQMKFVGLPTNRSETAAICSA